MLKYAADEMKSTTDILGIQVIKQKNLLYKTTEHLGGISQGICSKYLMSSLSGRIWIHKCKINTKHTYWLEKYFKKMFHICCKIPTYFTVL